jgi:hypothetical protein
VKLIDSGIQEREIKVQFTREVLIEHRLGHPGALGDVIHAGCVIPGVDENLKG